MPWLEGSKDAIVRKALVADLELVPGLSSDEAAVLMEILQNPVKSTVRKAITRGHDHLAGFDSAVGSC